MTAAQDFAQRHGTNAVTMMTALDAAGIPADQDWDHEQTVWTFADGSRITISGPIVEIQGAIVTIGDWTGPMDTARALMDEELCEAIHGTVDTEQEFADAYCAAHLAKHGETFVVN